MLIKHAMFLSVKLNWQYCFARVISSFGSKFKLVCLWEASFLKWPICFDDLLLWIHQQLRWEWREILILNLHFTNKYHKLNTIHYWKYEMDNERKINVVIKYKHEIRCKNKRKYNIVRNKCTHKCSNKC